MGICVIIYRDSIFAERVCYCLKKGDVSMAKTVFKRKIYDEIMEWKNNRSDKYALLIISFFNYNS